MSLFETLGIAVVWAALIAFIVVVWHSIHGRQARAAAAPLMIRTGYLTQLGPPKCNCGICAGRVALPLSTQEVANVQAGVLAVVGGVTRVVAAGADYMTASGVGRVALIICDDALFTQVVEPAIEKHLRSA